MSLMMVIFCEMVSIEVKLSLAAIPIFSIPLAEASEIFSVCRALSEFWAMLEDICSMVAETSSTDAACSLAPCDSCWDVPLSCKLAEAICPEFDLIVCTILLMLPIITDMLFINSPISSFLSASSADTDPARSPFEILSNKLTADETGTVILLVNRMAPTLIRRIISNTTIIALTNIFLLNF